MSKTMAHPPARYIAPLPMAWAGALLAVVLVVVAAARIAGVSPVEDMGKADVVASRLIRFDSDQKSVTLVDPTTGAVIAHTNQEGFIPGVLRGLKRMRQTEQAGMSEAWRLEKLSNGQLVLIDTVSGVSLDLAAYGHTNAATFAAFLQPQGDKS